MSALFIATVIVVVGFIKVFSYGVWEIKNKNILGGIMAIILAISSVVLAIMAY